MTWLSGPYVTGCRCVVCGKRYAVHEVAYVCPLHGDDGILDIEYDYSAASAVCTPATLTASGQLGEQGMWRYRQMLPLPLDAPVPPLLVGATPLYEAPRLAQRLDVQHVFVKDDGRAPTASFKDRASAVAVAQAKACGVGVVATASTGNAAAALAGMAASMEQPCVIFVPASAPPAKIAQLLAYGATVFAVQGTYDQAFSLCLDACKRFGWYNRNTAFNPSMAEGKKTAAYELCEQLGWHVPDAVVVSVGDGCIIAGLYKGFYDLLNLGLITRLPRLYGVQAAGSDFLMQAFERNEDVLNKPAIEAHTVADSIAAGLPRDRVKAMAAVRASGGGFVRVTDEAILAAIPELAQGSGVFAEPAGAAAWAGAKVLAHTGCFRGMQNVSLLVTGSGLKDVASAAQAAKLAGSAPVLVSPTPGGLEQALRKAQLLY